MVILIRAIRRGFKPYKYILVFIRPITTVYINLPYPSSSLIKKEPWSPSGAHVMTLTCYGVKM